MAVSKITVLDGAAPDGFVYGTASSITATATQVVASAGVGLRFYLTTLMVTNSSGSDSVCRVLDGATEIAVVSAAASSGAVVTYPLAHPFSLNTAAQFAASPAVNRMYVTMDGYHGT